ncbi:MAG: rhomboid family intramembrane serine protease [Bacilli bacterium]|nr:rhomboid family intramembrane serine protease [Bacilli bacterium]
MSIFSGYNNLKDYFKKSPVSSMLIIILFFITAIQFIFGHFSTQSLINFGALQKDLVLEGDYYRLFTVMFLHGSIEHFFSNAVIGIFILGGTLERTIKTWRYLVIYFIGGLGASLTIILTSNDLTVGASGAIFAALGSLLYLTFFRQDIISKPERVSIWTLIGIEMLFTFLTANISIAGHVGGLVFGFLLSFLVIRKYKIPQVKNEDTILYEWIEDSFLHNNDDFPIQEQEEQDEDNQYIQ